MQLLAQVLMAQVWCLVQRKVEDWKKTDISKWLAVLDMTKYENSFKTVSGKVRGKGSGTLTLYLLMPGQQVSYCECVCRDCYSFRQQISIDLLTANKMLMPY